jgi:nitroreductase
MDLKDAIRARHAVRAYTGQSVDEASVRLLLEAAVRAPSAKNEQPWAFAIVQNRAQLERYSDLAKAALLAAAAHVGSGALAPSERLLQDDSFNIFYGAGTLIVICALTESGYAQADCWIAAQNLMLAACDLGLGTCPIGLSVGVLNTSEVKAELGIPARACAVAPIVVGHPDGPTALTTPRSAPRVLSWRHAT